MNRLWGLIPAAGIGQRFGRGIPKQYTPLAGVAMIMRSLTVICDHPAVDGVYVGVAANDQHWTALGFDHPKFAGAFKGGDARFETVRLGLEAIVDERSDEVGSNDAGCDGDWVIVHDAARPLLHEDDLTAVITAARSHPSGALLGVPVTDAVKRADNRSNIVESVDRDGLWRALTPQVFTVSALLAALRQCQTAGVIPLDEADAMQFAGFAPRMVLGRGDNIKITHAADMSLAERLLRSRDN